MDQVVRDGCVVALEFGDGHFDGFWVEGFRFDFWGLGGRHVLAGVLELLFQPLVANEVDDQVDAVVWAMVGDGMRQGDIGEPAFAGAHFGSFAIEDKLDFGIGLNGDVEAELSFAVGNVVAVFLDDASRREAHEADGCLGAFEGLNDLANGGA